MVCALSLYHAKIKSKNSFYGQSKKRDRIKIATTTSFCKTARRARARRAKLIPLPKRNGRPFRPPANSSGKKKKVLSWSIFTTTLELILSKIAEKNNRPPRRSAGRAGTQTRRLGRKKFFWDVGQKEIFCALAENLGKSS